MKRPYTAPMAQSLTFKGLQLLDATFPVSGTTDVNPNQAKKHTFLIKPDCERLDEQEERFNETAQSFSLPRYSVWE